jgi:hypothetical protein
LNSPSFTVPDIMPFCEKVFCKESTAKQVNNSLSFI